MNSLKYVIEQGLFTGLSFTLLLFASVQLNPNEYASFAIVIAFASLFQSVLNPIVIDRMFINGFESQLKNSVIQFFIIWAVLYALLFLYNQVYAVAELNYKHILWIGLFGWGIGLIWVLRRWFLSFSKMLALRTLFVFYATNIFLLFGILFFQSESFLFYYLALTSAVPLMVIMALILSNNTSSLYVPEQGGVNQSSLGTEKKPLYAEYLIMSLLAWVPSNALFFDVEYSVEAKTNFRIYLTFFIPLGTVLSALYLLYMKEVSTQRKNIKIKYKWLIKFAFIISFYYAALLVFFLLFDGFYYIYGKNADSMSLFIACAHALISFSIGISAASIKAGRRSKLYLLLLSAFAVFVGFVFISALDERNIFFDAIVLNGILACCLILSFSRVWVLFFKRKIRSITRALE